MFVFKYKYLNLENIGILTLQSSCSDIFSIVCKRKILIWLLEFSSSGRSRDASSDAILSFRINESDSNTPSSITYIVRIRSLGLQKSIWYRLQTPEILYVALPAPLPASPESLSLVLIDIECALADNNSIKPQAKSNQAVAQLQN